MPARRSPLARAEDSLVAAVHIRLLSAVRACSRWSPVAVAPMEVGGVVPMPSSVHTIDCLDETASRPDDILSRWLQSIRCVQPVASPRQTRHTGGRDRWRLCAEYVVLVTAAGHQVESRGMAAGPAGVSRRREGDGRQSWCVLSTGPLSAAHHAALARTCWDLDPAVSSRQQALQRCAWQRTLRVRPHTEGIVSLLRLPARPALILCSECHAGQNAEGGAAAGRRRSSGRGGTALGYWRLEPRERLAALAALCDDVVDTHVIRRGLELSLILGRARVRVRLRRRLCENVVDTRLVRCACCSMDDPADKACQVINGESAGRAVCRARGDAHNAAPVWAISAN